MRYHAFEVALIWWHIVTDVGVTTLLNNVLRFTPNDMDV